MNSNDVISRLCEENEKLVYYMLNKTSWMFHDFREAEGHAFEGLFNAARYFDESKGYEFSSYAGKSIYNAIANYAEKEREFNGRYKTSLIVETNRGKEKDLFEDLDHPEEEEYRRPQHTRDPLSLLLEKDQKQYVQQVVEEIAWEGDIALNTLFDYCMIEENMSQSQLARIYKDAQASVSNRLADLVEIESTQSAYEHIKKRKRLKQQLKQQLMI